MADNMSPCPVCERADLVRQYRIVDLAETLAGWEVATSARFPASLWARFRALGKTVLYRCPACRFAHFEPVAAVDADFYKNISSRQGKRLT
jgi:hypothetical protein